MLGFIRGIMQLRYEFREKYAQLEQDKVNNARACGSCEILKTQVNELSRERDRLLDKLINTETDNPPIHNTEERPRIPIMTTRHRAWSVQRQMIENEHRVKASANKAAAQPDNRTESLERELGVAPETESAAATAEG